MTTLIKNGTVVSATGSSPQDVLVDGETVVALLAPGSQALGDVGASADTVIDAAGKYVIPGGIDGHTHMEMPFGGTFASDTFETGSRAAAWGGTTTFVDFVVQAHGQRVQDQVAAWHDKAGGNCAIDYAFHQIIGGVDDESLKAMDELIDEGITSFKLFMAYPGRLPVLGRADRAGHAGGGRQRRPDHDARRERFGHRRSRPAGARPR